MSDTLAGASPVDQPVWRLVPCPLCGCDSGYRLNEGSTYRWWGVNCGSCSELVAECRSDGRTDAGRALPKRWQAADAAWNEAGRHAQELRTLLDKVRALVKALIDANEAAGAPVALTVAQETAWVALMAWCEPPND